jgi:hypothetical protein
MTTTTRGSRSTPSSSSTSRTCSTLLQVHSHRDADYYERMVGGERYEMVPLPDSMMDTTLFVGNLNEFAKDGDLSNLFKAVSIFSVPACVVRRPNMDSLEYGFATFPTVEEKEVGTIYLYSSFRGGLSIDTCIRDCLAHLFAFVVCFNAFLPSNILYSFVQAAILRFHGLEFMGRRIKVEPIIDHPKRGRVKIPERMVTYVVGAAKQTRSGGDNTMRRIARVEDANANAANHQRKNSLVKRQGQQPLRKKKGLDRRKRPSSQLLSRLTGPDQEEWHRAARRGYVTLDGTGYRRGRKTSSLACAHRQWCDEQQKPQLVLCKASGGRPLDCVIVDLSPLIRRLVAQTKISDRTAVVTVILVEWKRQILAAAADAGMELRRDYEEDNCETLSSFDDDDEEEEEKSSSLETTLTEAYSWATEPISKLPVLSMGVFEGERIKAKAMARELAVLWDIPEETESLTMNSGNSASDSSSPSSNNNKQGKPRRDRKDENRKRRRNQPSEMDFFF